MARLNTAIPPSSSRASSVLQERTPQTTSRSTARSTPYATLSPTAASSDKENESTPLGARDKGKTVSMGPPKLPTPVSDTPRPSKRRRTGEHDVTLSVDGHEQDAATLVDLKYYDPDQDEEERREVRKDMRSYQRELYDRRDEFLEPDNDGLVDYVNRMTDTYGRVKQTADAVYDSRNLVETSDLALKKTNRLVLGDTSIGIDVDEFVSKCITFMRNGGPLGEDEEEPASTQARNRRQSRRNVDSDEDEEDDGDALDWETFGERACFPNNSRPPVPGFLLGPLSVEKRKATTTQRTGRQQKKPTGPTRRPESLEPEDLARTQASNLTTLCTNIRKTLVDTINKGVSACEEEMAEDMDEEEVTVLLRRHRMAQNKANEPCVSLLDFAVNPHSFGQTIENLFYISFLIKEGTVAVEKDHEGLPVLVPSKPRKIADQREQNISRNQAIFSLDWPTWQSLIEAFDIEEPLIPHRQDDEGQQVTARGWYG
ncbi:hypothetical protein W97_03652 [Coniosporium apollinis CBS 100218]|uniref:Non-structural maintenance of chromosomes element 4 n=1 Tax=Coniosporium apollinis (strain CBS 100218) TaxID=1168221 RepID=R7YRX3_CONA1|nr:uncharacterized protein W97_03652 [Coniosporium apollinis CBS 100218]EON64421.1 hypothetical protein W97_03652 [Coniosporium apollinis CBS 100218]